MSSMILGFTLIGSIVFWALKNDLNIYLQLHSFVIVIGGSIAILLYSTPNTILKNTKDSVLSLFKSHKVFNSYFDDLQRLIKNRNDSTIKDSHPLIIYACQLWQQGMESDLFIPLLSQKRRELEFKDSDGVLVLKTLAKYPPTLGMAGTVMGMISLFSNLDHSKDKIGSSLSIALTATFFGLILSNMLIAPIADRLQIKQMNDHRHLDNIYEILLLINKEESEMIIQDEIKERAAA